jgi:hypothetical protein
MEMLELAYWARENHLEYSILWVPALSEATFEQAYAAIATKLAMRECERMATPIFLAFCPLFNARDPNYTLI